ncbi:hypothetical protein NM688_g7221 [Phlebia brevispora]|uniref:Uncharacterized protein n=1 Tax=Phlebia brevispora TaxID=194682 RepID=A0ACC1S7Y3_9APHY|nr:hypothetical protein NM688_g7221 [Phlebia brevispora]
MSYARSASANTDIALHSLVEPGSHIPASPDTPSMFTQLRRQSTISAENPFLDKTRRRQLLRSYAPDWIITIGLAAIFLALDRVDGFKREFSLEDTSLRHPFTVHERVPDPLLYVICFAAPVLLQPLINYLTIRSWWDLHNGTLGLVLALCITGALTQITKVTVGRPRPDLIARCIPRPGSMDPQWGLSSAEICTQTEWYKLTDGWRSFPSGHSSMSFAGLGFLSFYLSGKLHLFDKKGYAPKAWLALSPLCGAALVAISRTMDYRRKLAIPDATRSDLSNNPVDHWQDVVAGSLLGLCLAYFSYRQYYPSLASEVSHRPYSPRIKREGPILPVHRSVDTSIDHEMDGGHHEASSQLLYHDTEEDSVPEGTVPRPERTMTNIWKDEDEEELAGQTHQ